MCRRALASYTLTQPRKVTQSGQLPRGKAPEDLLTLPVARPGGLFNQERGEVCKQRGIWKMIPMRFPDSTSHLLPLKRSCCGAGSEWSWELGQVLVLQDFAPLARVTLTLTQTLPPRSYLEQMRRLRPLCPWACRVRGFAAENCSF